MNIRAIHLVLEGGRWQRSIECDFMGNTIRTVLPQVIDGSDDDESLRKVAGACLEEMEALIHAELGLGVPLDDD